jgi:DNA-binding HxlR family transcriptional regulator
MGVGVVMDVDATKWGAGYRNVTGYRCRVDNRNDVPTFDPACPMSAFPVQIGDKWTAMILLCLEGRSRRFTELRQALGSVSAKVLTETLRVMERDGLLRRDVFAENPPRVEYQLTPLGRTLLQLVEAARVWAQNHLDDLLAARMRYDDELLSRAGTPALVAGAAAVDHPERAGLRRAGESGG